MAREVTVSFLISPQLLGGAFLPQLVSPLSALPSAVLEQSSVAGPPPLLHFPRAHVKKQVDLHPPALHTLDGVSNPWNTFCVESIWPPFLSIQD